MSCWEQDLVSIGTASLMTVATAAITLQAAWQPESIRWIRSRSSVWALAINGLLGAITTFVAIKQGVLAPSDCGNADLVDAFRGVLGAIPAAAAVAVLAKFDPDESKGTAVNLFAPIARLLIQGAVSDIEARRAACGGELLEPLEVEECVEHFPSWLTNHHRRLAQDPDFIAALNRLVTVSTTNVRPSAIRSEAGGVLLCWLPVRTLRRNVATYVGQRP